MNSPRPLTADDFAQRMQRAAEQATAAGLTGILVSPGPDLTYFTGYAPTAMAERITMLVIQPGRRPAMVVPVFERPDAQAAPGAAAVTMSAWADGENEYELTARLLGEAGRYAVSDATWAMHVLGLQQQLPQSRYVSMTSALPMLRAVKEAGELARLAAAGAAVDAAFEELAGLPFGGRRETEIAADLADLMRQHGHSQIDFTLVGSGPNGANPHHAVSDRTIADGDMIVLDFGGIRDGYASDITRMVHVGEPTDEEREVFEIVRLAEQAGVDAVGPGVSCQDIDRAARQVIAEVGYGEYFTHRAGHGIGLTGHEPPYMVEGETIPIEPGMTFSVEPGIYLPGRFGVRIEDIVAATETGARRLTNSSRELRIVA